MRENQKLILDNFFQIKDLKYRERYQVVYTTRDITELDDLGLVYMGEDITIKLYEDKQELQHYLRVMLNGEEFTLLDVPPIMSRAFANYLGFRLYSILYILSNEDSLDIMNDLRADFLYQ